MIMEGGLNVEGLMLN